MIAANVVALIFDSVPSIHHRYGEQLRWFEVASVALFSVEYIARLWSCTASSAYASSFWGRLAFARKPLSIVDLLAVLPFYLPFIGVDLRSLRLLRILRLVRIVKIGRYSACVQMIGRVLRQRREELAATAFIGLLLLLISSSLIYYAEHLAQPESFGSIPRSMWWAVATLTTVGYGDVYPVTTMGRITAALSAAVGIGLFALPTGVLGAAFVEELRNEHGTRKCAHCGKTS